MRITTPEFRARLKASLQQAFGARFRKLILYGSEARGEATQQSDIDLLLLVDGPVDLLADIERSVRAVQPLQFELLDHPIHVNPTSEDVYERAEYAIYRNARKDAVEL